MDWFRKHTDLVIMLTAFASAMLWLNGKFNDIEKDIAIMKTVLVIRNIMPSELAKCHEDKKVE
jgi:hypothetical protein